MRKLAAEAGGPCIAPVTVTRRGLHDPAGIYFTVRRSSSPSFLLESAEGPAKATRYSIVGFDPILHLRVEGGGRVRISGQPLGPVNGRGDSLDILRRAAAIGSLPAPRIPLRYQAACFGFISYDFVRESVSLGEKAADDLLHPVLEFILPSCLIVFDHERAETTFACVLVADGGRNLEEKVALARKKLGRMMEIRPSRPGRGPRPERVRSNVPRRGFEEGVRLAKEYIRAGDIIQVVLSRRLEMEPAPHPEEFYHRLRSINPSPYMFFLDFPERMVVGSSPELLVRVSGREVITRPIAGTRRRRPGEDERLGKELLEDEKERAEHVMLVDLGRNDIGRVCQFGSVRVKEFMKVERYSHVQHLVSTVAGRLRRGEDAFDALRATFPAGTVTGAPKVRAMEIIEELEPVRRGIYAGSVGSFSYTGDADLAITIRTMVIQNGRGYVQVGAGIVADSVPWKEYYETENKARALLSAAGLAA